MFLLVVSIDNSDVRIAAKRQIPAMKNRLSRKAKKLRKKDSESRVKDLLAHIQFKRDLYASAKKISEALTQLGYVNTDLRDRLIEIVDFEWRDYSRPETVADSIILELAGLRNTPCQCETCLKRRKKREINA